MYRVAWQKACVEELTFQRSVALVWLRLQMAISLALRYSHKMGLQCIGHHSLTTIYNTFSSILWRWALVGLGKQSKALFCTLLRIVPYRVEPNSKRFRALLCSLFQNSTARYVDEALLSDTWWRLTIAIGAIWHASIFPDWTHYLRCFVRCETMRRGTL